MDYTIKPKEEVDLWLLKELILVSTGVKTKKLIQPLLDGQDDWEIHVSDEDKYYIAYRNRPYRSVNKQDVLLQAYCVLQQKFGLYVNYEYEIDWDNYQISVAESVKACPFLLDRSVLDVDGWCLLLFDTEEEVHNAFDLVVGDDGSTEKNPYDGPAKVYAMVIDKDGTIHRTNT